METEDGMLVDVPADKLDEWSAMQGQEADPQLKEMEDKLLEQFLEMLYGNKA